MRKRRKSTAPWLFFFVGLVLVFAFAVAVLAFAGSQGWLSPEWQGRVENVLEHARGFLPSEAQIRFLVWLGGIAGTAITAAFTLLASWHFAEMNLPQRIQDLKESHTRDHLSLQPTLLALARRGLGPVAADIETSRVTLLRKWLSWWSEKERARVLAASTNLLAREASALSAAAQASQHQQITAHIVRGYQHASQGDDEKAFKEFEAATKVKTDDIISRDIAAGWARKTNKQKRELELLKELQHAASSVGLDIDHARALRREAELLDKRKSGPDWIEARNRLKEARGLLQPLIADNEARLELGRVLTLFCEVQCSRTVVGQLSGHLTRMRSYMVGVATRPRPEEPDGEAYGEERASRVEDRVADILGDVRAEGDSNDN